MTISLSLVSSGDDETTLALTVGEHSDGAGGVIRYLRMDGTAGGDRYSVSAQSCRPLVLSLNGPPITAEQLAALVHHAMSTRDIAPESCICCGKRHAHTHSDTYPVDIQIPGGITYPARTPPYKDTSYDHRHHPCRLLPGGCRRRSDRGCRCLRPLGDRLAQAGPRVAGRERDRLRLLPVVLGRFGLGLGCCLPGGCVVTLNETRAALGFTTHWRLLPPPPTTSDDDGEATP